MANNTDNKTAKAIHINELRRALDNAKVLQDSIAISRSEIQNIDNAMAARKQADMNPNQSPNQNYNQNPNNNQKQISHPSSYSPQFRQLAQ